MLLSLQMDFSFVRAAVACAILERTSGLEPSSETTAPRYLKLGTVPNFCPFTFFSLWMPLALFVISLVFSALISILYLVQVLSRLSTRAFSSCSSSARESMSSANHRLVIFLPPMLTFPSCSSRASDMIRSRKMLKRVGDRRHPCLTPTVVLNHSPMLPFIWTAHVALSMSCSMVRTRFALILYFRMYGCMPYSVKGFFEINEDMVQLLLMLEVLFTQDSKVEDLFCGVLWCFFRLLC